MKFSSRSRVVHWSAPFAVAGVIGLIALVPNFSAEATPNLPKLTPQQLIVKVQQANVPALSGTLRVTSNLGLPSLASLGGSSGGENAFNPVDLLSGSNQAKIWYDGPQLLRIAVIRSMAEYDVIHNGKDLWTWDSAGSRVQHTVLPAGGKAENRAEAPSQSQTPDQMARSLLNRLDESTAVSVATPANIAGRSVYELVLRPVAPASTVDHASIAVDAKTGFPLQISLFAKGQKTPAFQLGFTSVSFSRPGASNFTFMPPPGSTMVANGAPSSQAIGQGARLGKRARHFGGHRAFQAAPRFILSGASGPPIKVGHDWTPVYIYRNIQLPPQADQALSGASKVTGAFGTGRLLQTSLINVLFLNDGRVAVGAVTPSALEAAVASTS